MKIHSPAFALLLAFLALLSGCNSSTLRSRDVVLVDTKPAGAMVFVNDEPAGPAPVELELWGDIPHRVRVEAPGYESKSAYIYPVDRDDGGRTVTFGLLRDAGYYYKLNTDMLEVELRNSLIPETSAGFEKSAIERQLDQQMAAGELSLEDRAIAQLQLDEVFAAE